ncbi:MAG: sel1 repeat family protein [Clostridiales bacterium]|nr:sel1 repeat family protein [Clostridiales bacterium]
MPGEPTTSILFYVNAALAFCVITEFVTLISFAKKTAYEFAACETAAMVHVFGLAAFIVQLVMYSIGKWYAIYAVYVALGIMIASVLTTAVYCFFLSPRSNSAMCIVTGILCVVQPVGIIFLLILRARMHADSRAEAVVFTGNPYTYATLEDFHEKFKLDYVDNSSQGEFEKLDKKALKAHLKELKSKATDPDGQFHYGEALINYCPNKASKGADYIKRAAQKDHPSALFNLGYFNEVGMLGFKKSYKKSNEYYSRAAKLGDHDAAMRMGIADIEIGYNKEGYEVFKKYAAEGDKCAIYNVAVCQERGVSVTKNILEAVDTYKSIKTMHLAQQRLFALAVPCITYKFDMRKDKSKSQGPDRDELFNRIVAGEYDGDFKVMIEGLVKIKKGAAHDAAEIFLGAVKKRGKWEGVARCLVGALYLDCGALSVDRANGAAYVKSAFGMTPIAKDIYNTIPNSVISPKNRNKRA